MNALMNISVMVKIIVSLAFVPIEDSDKATNLLADELPNEIIVLFEWFKKYIGKKSKKNGSSNTSIASRNIELISTGVNKLKIIYKFP